MMMHILTPHSSAHAFARLFVRSTGSVPACETALSSSFGDAHCDYRVSGGHKRLNANTIGLLTHRTPIAWRWRRLIGTRPRSFGEWESTTRRGDISESESQQQQRHIKFTRSTQANRLLRQTHDKPSHAHNRMLAIQKMDLMGLWSSVQARLLGTSTSNLPPRHAVTNGNDECELDERGRKQVKIRACGELYQELARTRPMLYGSAPSCGIQFDVDYFDSRELLSGNHKSEPTATVCLLHGAPGQYSDFASLIEHLTRRGVRVVAPNFPDYNATYKHSFRHSPPERCEFLQEFFKAIQVQDIDMLIGHSSAVYTMFELLERTHSTGAATPIKTIRSLGLFSTPSHRLPSNMAPTPFRLFTLKLFDYPLLRPLILACLLTFVRLQGIRNRVDRNKVENLLIAASAVGYSEHEKMAVRMGLLREHKIPVLVVYGTNDRLIRASAFEQLEQDLGASQGIGGGAAVKRYRSDGTLDSHGSESGGGGGASETQTQLVNVCRFESGGHYTFQRYAEQVNEEVHQFLSRRVLPAPSETTRL